MEVSFGKQGGEAPVEIKTQVPTPAADINVESTTTVGPEGNVGGVSAPGTQEVVKTNSSGFPLGDDLPGFQDVILPRVNLVHDVGGLKDTFSPGEIVFDQRTVLFSPPNAKAKTEATPPVNITVLGIISKRFSEKIEGGVGGMIVKTEAAVRENGGTLDYNEWKLKKASGMKRFEHLNDMLVAIRRPEHVKDDDTVFTFAVGPAKYALGVWAVKGSAYTHAYKRVLAHARIFGVLRTGYPSHSFSLTTRLETTPGVANPYWVPVLVPATKSTPEFLEFVMAILNPTKA